MLEGREREHSRAAERSLIIECTIAIEPSADFDSPKMPTVGSSEPARASRFDRGGKLSALTSAAYVRVPRRSLTLVVGRLYANGNFTDSQRIAQDSVCQWRGRVHVAERFTSRRLLRQRRANI